MIRPTHNSISKRDTPIMPNSIGSFITLIQSIMIKISSYPVVTILFSISKLAIKFIIYCRWEGVQYGYSWQPLITGFHLWFENSYMGIFEDSKTVLPNPTSRSYGGISFIPSVCIYKYTKIGAAPLLYHPFISVLLLSRLFSFYGERYESQTMTTPRRNA